MAVGLFVLICSFQFVIAKREGFIVGGEYTHNVISFPWSGFLSFTDSDGSFGCGSTIINQYVLVTSANCFNLNEFYEITVTIGHFDTQQGILQRVESYKLHNRWDPFSMRYDIALCKTKTEMFLKDTVMRLMVVNEPPEVDTALLVGWGAIEEKNYRQSSKSKYIHPKVWTREDCTEFLDDLPEGTFCGGKEKEDDYVSSGDEGSGLIYNKSLIIGLYSYKDIKASRSLGVYTNVSHYYKWIVRCTEELICP